METDNMLNYQILALDIIVAAIEDAQSTGPEAYDAKQWLDGIDISSLGIEGLTIDELMAYAHREDGR